MANKIKTSPTKKQDTKTTTSTMQAVVSALQSLQKSVDTLNATQVKANVSARSMIPASVVSFVVYVGFITRYRHEIFVVEVGMIDKQVVVCKRDYRISESFVKRFQLFHGETAVGYYRVAVHIRFVEIAVFRNKIFFHFSFLRVTAVLLCQ